MHRSPEYVYLLPRYGGYLTHGLSTLLVFHGIVAARCRGAGEMWFRESPVLLQVSLLSSRFRRLSSSFATTITSTVFLIPFFFEVLSRDRAWIARLNGMIVECSLVRSRTPNVFVPRIVIRWKRRGEGRVDRLQAIPHRPHYASILFTRSARLSRLRRVSLHVVCVEKIHTPAAGAWIAIKGLKPLWFRRVETRCRHARIIFPCSCCWQRKNLWWNLSIDIKFIFLFLSNWKQNTLIYFCLKYVCM